MEWSSAWITEVCPTRFPSAPQPAVKSLAGASPRNPFNPRLKFSVAVCRPFPLGSAQWTLRGVLPKKHSKCREPASGRLICAVARFRSPRSGSASCEESTATTTRGTRICKNAQKFATPKIANSFKNKKVSPNYGMKVIEPSKTGKCRVPEVRSGAAISPFPLRWSCCFCSPITQPPPGLKRKLHAVSAGITEVSCTRRSIITPMLSLPSIAPCPLIRSQGEAPSRLS